MKTFSSFGFAEGFVCRGGAYHTAPAGDKQNPVAAAFRTERRCDGNLAFWPCMQWNRSGKGRSKDDSGKAGEILRPKNGGGIPPSAAERRQDETTSGQQVAPLWPKDCGREDCCPAVLKSCCRQAGERGRLPRGSGRTTTGRNDLRTTGRARCGRSARPQALRTLSPNCGFAD